MRGFVIVIMFVIFSLPKVKGQIIVRNTCLNQCVNCSSAAKKSPTVFEWTGSVPSGSTFVWDFGEPTNPQDISNKKIATHQYCGSDRVRTYDIKVTITDPSGNSNMFTDKVTIGNMPTFFLGKDSNDTTITICPSQEPIPLNPFLQTAKPNSVVVTWYPSGKIQDTIHVKKSGCYSVEIKDINSGCTSEAFMQVKVCAERDPDQNVNEKKQKQWHFGQGCAIELTNPSNPRAIPSTLNVPNGVAKMEDPTIVNGLLFYTDGINVFDKNQILINPGQPLNNLLGTAQGVTIIPKTACKGCQAEYYIFTLNQFNGNYVVYYSILDMRLNGGKGGISTPPKILSTEPTTTRILASQGGDDYYWLITQDANSSNTRSYKISSSGISAPIITGGGTIIPAFTNSTTKVSWNWTKMAVSIPGPPSNIIDLYNMDPISGKATLTKSLNLGPAPPTIYGVEFSKDTTIMYVSTQGNGSTIKSEIWQFDLTLKTSALIESSKKVLFTALDFETKYGALQIDPINETTIFVAINNSNYLGKISNIEKLKGSSPLPEFQPKFDPQGVLLSPGCSSQLGLPPSIPVPSAPSGPPKIKQSSCEGKTFKYSLTGNLCDPKPNGQIKWKVYETTLALNPDPNTGIMVPLNLSSIIPKFTQVGNECTISYDHSGTYVITAEVSNECVPSYLLDGQEFQIALLDPVVLSSEFNRICDLSADIQLDQTPLSSNLVYEWNYKGNIQTNPIASIPKLGSNPGGLVTLKLTDTTTKCFVIKTTRVNFINTSNIFDVPKPFICMEPPILPLTIKLNSGIYDLGFNWSGPSVLGPATPPLPPNQINVLSNGQYQVDITDLRTNWNRCPPISASITVLDKCERSVIAPNIFTPKVENIASGQSINDYFIPKEIPRTTVKQRINILNLQIFNRWGERIFYKEKPTSSPEELKWDGYNNGKPVPQESYVWVVEFQEIDFPEKGIQTQRGAVIVAY